MRHFPFSGRFRRTAFTLIELIAVIAIIALLATLLLPVLSGVMEKADTTRCANNVKQIGTSVLAYCADHDNRLPMIETDPTNPVYTPEAEAKPLAEVLKNYGVSKVNLQCAADLKAKLNFQGNSGASTSFFESKGTSYEWRPTFDGELINSAKLVGERFQFVVPPSRMRLLVDYVNAGEAPHERSLEASSYNNFYADGHVSTLTIRKVDKEKGW